MRHNPPGRTFDWYFSTFLSFLLTAAAPSSRAALDKISAHHGWSKDTSSSTSVPVTGSTTAMSVCLSVCLSVFLSVCLSVCLSVYQWYYIFINQNYYRLNQIKQSTVHYITMTTKKQKTEHCLSVSRITWMDITTCMATIEDA